MVFAKKLTHSRRTRCKSALRWIARTIAPLASQRFQLERSNALSL